MEEYGGLRLGEYETDKAVIKYRKRDVGEVSKNPEVREYKVRAVVIKNSRNVCSQVKRVVRLDKAQIM